MIKIKNGAATDSIVLTFVRIVTAAISIVIYKMLTVNFSLEEYGLYSTAMLIVTTVTSFSILGFTDAINYFYNREKDNNRGETYVQTIFALQIFIGIASAVLIVLLKKQIINYFGEEDIGGMLPYIAFLPLLSNLLSMMQVLFVSYKKAKVIAVRNFVLSVVKVIFVGASCYLLKNITAVIISTLIIDILSILYMLIYCKRHMFAFNMLHSDFHLSKGIFSYSIPMAAYIITNSLSRNIDKMVIGNLGSTEDLAIYTVASKELPFDMLTAAFVTVLIPYITRFIAKNDNQRACGAFSKYLQITYTIIWILAFGAIAASKELMLLLYDEKYLAGLSIFVIYIVVDIIKFANVSLIFSAKAKTKELLCYSGSALVLNLILNIIFYKWLGLPGPALSTVIVTLLLSFAMLLRSSILLESSILQLLNIKRAIIILFECSICAAAAYFIKRCFITTEYTVLRFGITYGIYIIPLIILNFKYVIGLLKDINNIKLS